MNTRPDSPCPLCDGTDYRLVTMTPGCAVYVCQVCALSRTVPLQAAPAAERYGAEYHQQHSYLRDPLNERVAQMRLTMLRRLRPTAQTFLDVGCATGYAMQVAQGWGWQVYGTDVSEFATDYARRERGLQHVYTGPLASASLPAAWFDLVYCHHVLEHLPDPLDTLREMYRVLKPDGLLYVAVPNLCSVKHYLRGDGWYTPYHLYNYRADTLRRMLERAGFRINRLWTDSPGFVPLRPRRRTAPGVPAGPEASPGRERSTGFNPVPPLKRSLIRAYAAVANLAADHTGRGDNLNALAVRAD